jgi:hypothetical protein
MTSFLKRVVETAGQGQKGSAPSRRERPGAAVRNPEHNMGSYAKKGSLILSGA